MTEGICGPARGVPSPIAGVSDGTRTRDICDHNAALYQLSYTHRGSLTGALEESTMPSTRP